MAAAAQHCTCRDADKPNNPSPLLASARGWGSGLPHAEQHHTVALVALAVPWKNQASMELRFSSSQSIVHPKLMSAVFTREVESFSGLDSYGL